MTSKKVDIDGRITLLLSVSTIGTYRTVSGKVIKSLEGEQPAGVGKDEKDRKRAKLRKEIIRGDFLKPFGDCDREFREVYNLVTSPGILGVGDRTPGKGHELVEILEMVDDYEGKRNALVEHFVAMFPEVKQDAKVYWKGLYNESDYPQTDDEIRSRFGISLTTLKLGVPDDLPESLKEQMRAELEKRWAQADLEGQQEKRDNFQEKVETLLKELQPGGRIFDSVIVGMQEYIKHYNPADDPDISEAVVRVGEVLKGVSAEDLRKFKGTKEMVVAVLGDIVPKVKGLDRLIDV